MPISYRVADIIASKIRHFLRKQRHIVLVVLLILFIPVARFCFFLAVPPGNGSKVEIVELDKGHSLRSLAGLMERRGIVSSATLFSWYARLKGADSRVKAGVYELNDGMRPAEILRKMLAGEYYQRLFAVPEGYSSYQLAEMLEKRGIFKKESFLDACHDPQLLAEMGIRAKSAEGYLFPGTYNILPGKSPREVVREMIQRQQEVLKETVTGKRNLALSQNELLTLASMVEKEAVLPAEKPLIAAVFQNRLRLGMRLQSDPTALYGVRAFAGKVSRHDILQRTPYNTYLIPGLPPGPIGNPGKDAIAAVLTPPPVPYLYFVARGDGSHQFSNDLTSHNQAVRQFLKTSAPVPPRKSDAKPNTPGRR